MSFLTRVFGDPNEKELRRVRPLVDQINGLEDEISGLSDDELRARTVEFREHLDQCEDQDAQDEVLDDILPEAFAVVREAGVRSIGMRHYDVQMIGGIVLHQGKIAEMGTGEGKTLVATLPAYLNALTGRGVHIVTTNDYLVQRDADWMGRIHRFLGLSVGTVLSGTQHLSYEEKSGAYGADITYSTNNEMGFDYLRDNMVVDIAQKVQRPLNFVIVDEVDNILIDEARTPLIISAPSAESPEQYVRFAKVAPILKEGEDYTVDLKGRTVAITDDGIDKIEAAMNLKNLYGDIEMTRYLENALKAQVIFLKDRDYIVRNGEVLIVDEHTGRVLDGRRYSEGLHQALEAKERVKVQAENRTVATITFQNYFRLYRKLAGMTGTALTEAAEFDKIYKLDVMVIPTNRPRIRKDATDLVYKTEAAKFDAVVEEIQRCNEEGQPVLVGTTSVDKSELLASKLDRVGIAYELLNAKNHQREADIIAQAGISGAVTISTNMAGRGTDIQLGGDPAGFVDQILSDLNIDLDVATEEDRAEAMVVAKQRCAEDHERVVGLGGLHVIGTERHDARRIDNQLRGRSGRQGDPGSSRFYISLQDDLMRRFGSDRVAALMGRMGMEDDMPIENKMISGLIEQAQQKVEAYYFDIRKHLVEYDDVIAKQRETIYEDRDALLQNEGIHERVETLMTEEIEELISNACSATLAEQWDLDAVVAIFDRWHMSVDDDFFPENLATLKRSAFIKQCVDYALEQREARLEGIRQQLLSLNIVSDIEVANQQLLTIDRNVMLQVVDNLWMEHIDNMDELRSSIGLRGIAQTDPLVEFKREGYASFDHLKEQIRHYVTETLMSTQLAVNAPPPTPVLQAPQGLTTNTEDIAAATGQSKSDGALVAAPEKKNGVSKKPLTQKKAQVQQRPSVGKPVATSKTPSRPLNGNGNGKSAGAPAQPLASAPTSKTPSRPITTKPTEKAPVAVARPVPRPLNGKRVALDPAALVGVGANDPCPCGSGQKFKFCHGLGKK